MRRPVLLLVFLFNIAIATAQVKKSSEAKSSKRTTQKIHQKKIINSPDTDTVISLLSASSHSAKSASPISANSVEFRVSDPTLVALGERAKGNEVFVSNSGIIGMPKRAYGFANGHILLHSTVSTSSGSTGGSSSVGTGGSLSGMGSSGAFIGMNGKSPYAGQSMWGNALGLLTTNY